ncbi:MAG: ABC transporter ATP-binding protein [Acidobacteriia bacterium]|nr:ABC transporter ATP-binding protein [Terriglobia bacterium]
MSFSHPTTTDPESAPAIVLSEVTKLYGRFAALRGVSAEFVPARLYLVLGDNGAGKSTLLRAIAGLMRPSRGTVTVLGSSQLRSAAAQIGYMAHAPLLYDEMDGMENLRYFARLYGIRGDQRCAEVMRAVGLDPALPRRVGQYSQGMRQRLSLARAILNDPVVVLLDEPFSNVDIVSAREMVRLLGEMRDAGKAVFVVTHQPALLDGVADESIFMDAGAITERRSQVRDELHSPRVS